MSLVDHDDDKSITVPPSQRLPPLKSLSSHASIAASLDYLTDIITPPLYSSGLKLYRSKTYDDVLDPFERAYVIQWLTFLCRKLPDGDLLESTSSLLAVIAGTASAGTTTRSYHFPRFRVRIRDIPLSNSDFGSVGGQTWSSSFVLSELLVHQLSDCSEISSILELGAGTGLVSIALAHHFASLDLPVRIQATDFHPAILANLKHNIQANRPVHSGVHLSSALLDWADSRPEQTKFDLIVAADIVYDHGQADLIHRVLKDTLLHPHGVFRLLIPRRKGHEFAENEIETLFHSEHELQIHHRELLVCDGAHDVEQEYLYYRIRWKVQ